jgi:shikimate kinase
MGSGKTCAGQAAAERLGVVFADTDWAVEESTGSTIEWIWENDGEPVFRKHESEVVGLLQGSVAIVATGGGVILDPTNRRSMKNSGPVVWLQASPQILAQRLGSHPPRPAMRRSELNPIAFLEDMLERRRSLYEAIASHRIDTDVVTPEETIREIEEIWKTSESAT